MSIIKEMVKWDIERNLIEFNKKNEVNMLMSEVNEFIDAPNEHEEIDGLADVIKVSVGAISKKGYDVELVLEEMLKEISSRKQNPTQKEIWEKWGAEGKWEKDKTQDPKTLYKADYSKCLLKNSN